MSESESEREREKERKKENVVFTRARAPGQDLELRPVADDVLRPSLYVAGFAAAMAAMNSVDFVPAQAHIVESPIYSNLT